jgi:hypothetical protein
MVPLMLAVMAYYGCYLLWQHRLALEILLLEATRKCGASSSRVMPCYKGGSRSNSPF